MRLNNVPYLAVVLCAMSLATASCGGKNTGASDQPASDTASEVTAPVVAPRDTNDATSDSIPREVRDFLLTYFPGKQITRCETEQKYGEYEYDILLNDGTEIDFDRDHLWDYVDCGNRTVPASLVPSEISTYIKQNRPSRIIVKIDKEPYGFDIKLDDGTELRFNRTGRYMSDDE